MLLAMFAPRTTHAADSLEPYRAFARGPHAAQVLTTARDAMRSYLLGKPAPAAQTIDWPAEPTALYVTLSRGAATRACVGSASPPGGNLSAAVAALAVQALSADRRRPPVRAEELENLRITIAFAGVGETIADPMVVDPSRHGLLIQSPAGSVAYLPGEARTVSWALRDARRSGLLNGPTRDASYQRFDVVTLKEPERPLRRERSDEK
jgi:AMMECR1 domain-containing protein